VESQLELLLLLKPSGVVSVVRKDERRRGRARRRAHHSVGGPIKLSRRWQLLGSSFSVAPDVVKVERRELPAQADSEEDRERTLRSLKLMLMRCSELLAGLVLLLAVGVWSVRVSPSFILKIFEEKASSSFIAEAPPKDPSTTPPSIDNGMSRTCEVPPLRLATPARIFVRRGSSRPARG
jgi:hypothetical protein